MLIAEYTSWVRLVLSMSFVFFRSAHTAPGFRCSSNLNDCITPLINNPDVLQQLVQCFQAEPGRARRLFEVERGKPFGFRGEKVP